MFNKKCGHNKNSLKINANAAFLKANVLTNHADKWHKACQQKIADVKKIWITKIVMEEWNITDYAHESIQDSILEKLFTFNFSALYFVMRLTMSWEVVFM